MLKHPRVLWGVYNALIYLLFPLIWLFLWAKPAYRAGLWTRLGFGLPKKRLRGGIWLHAASVGEVMAIAPLIEAILARYPNLPLTLTSFTPTGSQQIQARFGSRVQHCYLPLDLHGAVKRFLNWLEPELLLIAETELWPNLLRESHRRGIPIALVNARLSARSVRRYQKIHAVISEIFSYISCILAQDKVSYQHFAQLGVESEKLTCAGNLKFDLTLDATLHQKIDAMAAQLGLVSKPRPIWIAASTHEGEEALLLDAHRRLRERLPDALLLLVPRHPERFTAVEKLLAEQGWCYQKRSAMPVLQAQDEVLLVDSMGELLLFYGLSRVAFIGGSLITRGGHNPLEAIALNRPVVSGKFTFNFKDLFGQLRAAKGVLEVESEATSISEALFTLFSDSTRYEAVCAAGREILQANQGALSRHLTQLTPFFAQIKARR